MTCSIGSMITLLLRAGKRTLQVSIVPIGRASVAVIIRLDMHFSDLIPGHPMITTDTMHINA